MQPVGRLVGLRAQRFGESPLIVQLPRERLEFGVVAQGDHGTPAATARHGGTVDHQDPVRGQVHLVHPGPVREQGSGEGRGQGEVGDPGAPDLAGQAEQFAARVVDQGDPAPPVEHQQALPHPVEGRLVVVVHTAQLGGVHAVGVPAQSGVDDVRPHAAEGEGAGRDPHEGRELPGQPVADRTDGDARADHAHDPPVVQQRGDHADRGTEGAGVGLAEGFAPQRRGGVPEEGFADAARVAVGPAHPLRGHDRHEVHARVDPHPFRVGLERRRRVGPASGAPYRLDHRGRVGDRAGDGPGLEAGGLLGLAAGGRVGEDRAAGEDDGDQQHLHGEELAGEAARRSGEAEHGAQSAPGRELNERKGDRGHRLGDGLPERNHHQEASWPPGATRPTISTSR